MTAYATDRRTLSTSGDGAGEGRGRVRLGGRIGGSVHHFAGRADHPLRFELGNRLLVLLPAPVDVASLVDGDRRPEELVQTIVEQRVLGAVLLGDRTMRRTGRRRPSRARLVPAAVLAGGHNFPVRGPFFRR